MISYNMNCMNQVENFVSAFEDFSDQSSGLYVHNHPLITNLSLLCVKGAIYVANPFVNVTLTVIHLAKTLEKTIKVCYYVGTSILASLAVMFTLGAKKELNEMCVKQWVGLGLNLYSVILSLGFTFANVGAGLQGFFSTAKAIENEYWAIESQNALDRQFSLAHKNLSKDLFLWLNPSAGTQN